MSTVGPSPILLHVLDANHVWTGLYFWEYVTSLSYDWKYLIGRKERRWTTWVRGFLIPLKTTGADLVIADIPRVSFYDGRVSFPVARALRLEHANALQLSPLV